MLGPCLTPAQLSRLMIEVDLKECKSAFANAYLSPRCASLVLVSSLLPAMGSPAHATAQMFACW